MTQQHTPGPWHKELGSYIYARTSKVADAYFAQTESERTANARLIAAAPELLTALQEVVRVFDSHPSSITDTVWVTGESPETLYDHCRAAIAKATGGDHQPYKSISDQMIQATNGRVRIDPVTGNVGIGIVPAAIAKATGEK
jgi:hypothetical protein